MKDKAIENFYTKDVYSELLSSLICLENEFKAMKDEWKTAFINSFKGICKTIEEKQKAGTAPKASFLVYTLLRTNLLQGKEAYAIYLYDEDWYMGDSVKVGEIDVSHVYRFRNDLFDRLKKCAQKYALNIHAIDVENASMSVLNYYHQYIVGQMRYSMAEAIETEEFKLVEKAKSFEILAGEYYECCDLIYKYVQDENYEKTYQELKLDELPQYFCRDLRCIDLTGMDLTQSYFSYSILSGSTLLNAYMASGEYVGTKFINSNMINADLSDSDLYGADFSCSDLTGAIFDDCRAAVGKDILGDMEGPDYIGVKFTGSNLTDAGFKNATLLGANFTGAHLENANFEGAVITGSLFEKKHLEQVRFSDEQLESIQIYCERHQISAMPN